MRAARQVADLNDRIYAEGAYGAFYEAAPGLTRERDALLRGIEAFDLAAGNDKRGEWYVTVTGHRFWPFAPRAEDVFVEDIAHALSMLCRFCGHVKDFVSVAEHSVLVSRAVRPEYAMAGLLHDAPECYMGDLIHPLKARLPQYKEMEGRVMAAVCEAFGLDFDDDKMWAEVKRADNSALSTEFKYAARCSARVGPPKAPAREEMRPQFWAPLKARDEFLNRYREILWQ